MQFFSTSAEAQADALYDKDLSTLLATIIEMESQIEAQRSLLSENEKFETFEAFSSIDSHSRGYLTSTDLRQFLAKGHVATKEGEIEFLVYTFASDHKAISYRDFLQVILPKQDDNLKSQCLSRRRVPTSDQKKQLPFYLEEQISRIFEFEIIYIREIESQKIKLMNQNGWNYRESFKRICTRGQYFIDKLSFQDFMRRNGFNMLKEEAFKLLLIRFNKDDNQIITMDEFSSAIFPSDFHSSSLTPQSLIQQPNSPFLRYVKGQRQQFNEYIGTSNQNDEDDVFKFNQEDFAYRNDVHTFESQKRKQGEQNPRKFLKTSVQYENVIKTQHKYPVSTQEIDKNQYPILNEYLISKAKSPYQTIKNKLENYQYSPYDQQYQNFHETGGDEYKRGTQSNYQSPPHFLSSQRDQFLDYDDIQNNQKDLVRREQQQQYSEDNQNYPYPQQDPNEGLNNPSQLANSYVVNSQFGTKSAPYFPVNQNRSLAQAQRQPNYASQMTHPNQGVQPFKSNDFASSNLYYQ